ncbi:MAG: transposase [Longimicrobiales bacterium]
MRDLRWIADAYEQAQQVRIETGERIRAIAQGRDACDSDAREPVDAARLLADIRKGEGDGPVALLGRTYRRHWEAEQELRGAMTTALGEHPAWPWISQVKGIGATLAAKLLARLDVHRAPHPSSFWSYCGLATVPGIEYRCAVCGLRVSYPTRYRVKPAHTRADAKTACTGALEPARGPEHNVRVAQPKPAVGEKATYDRYAKKVCYLIGVSFIRTGSAYGAFYRRERARLEDKRRGWTGGRIHFAALRKTEKLFLAHLWVVWRRAEGLPDTTPYALAVLGRCDYIPPEAMVEPSCTDRDEATGVEADPAEEARVDA